jgi:Holliday junction resolvasome RuvABC endonuclease subunit
MSLKIIGIDASLSSTGIAIATCDLAEAAYNNLYKSLIEKGNLYAPQFKEFFKIDFSAEIKEIANSKKLLAKTRKEIRELENRGESPNLELNSLVERLTTERIKYQVDEILKVIEKYEVDNLLILIEDYSFHSKGSITQLAEMKGHLKVRIDDFIKSSKNNIYYFTVPVTIIKKLAARHGLADKTLMAEEIKRFGFGYTSTQANDEVDAIAICIAAFFTIYHKLFEFKIPDDCNRKERDFIKTFLKSMNEFGNRLGTREELKIYG